MSDRKVNKTGKDSDGDITALCSDESWSPRKKDDAIRDINSGTINYYVQQPGTQRSKVYVVEDKYLRTSPDGDPKNNLGNLPDC